MKNNRKTDIGTNSIVKWMLIICSLIIIIGIFLPWLSVLHTLPSTEAQPQQSPDKYSGWELSSLDYHEYPVADAVSGLLKLSTYLFLISGVIILIQALSNIWLKNIKFVYLCGILSILCSVFSTLNILEIAGLEGGDISYGVEYGNFLILFGGLISVITIIWMMRHEPRKEDS